MNEEIEIHDSILDDVVAGSAECLLHFKRVYIHRSTGRPGLDAGTVWVQEAQLRFREGVVGGRFSELPHDLHDGYIKLGESVLENSIPIPLDFEGEVEFRIEGWGEVITVRARHVRLEMLGSAEYVEEFAAN
jgi:hypothetical protein